MGDLPVTMAQLRELLAAGTDEQIESFLESFSLAQGATHLIAQMSPASRRAFFGSLVVQYADDFGLQTRAGLS